MAENSKSQAAIYIRVSTEEQARQGISLSAQEEALKNYASALGYDIFKVYRDEGKSAKDIKGRPEMRNLLEDAKNRKIQAIFIYKLDRFSRSLKDLIDTIAKLKEWGVDFVSLQDKIETTSASGKLMFHIISAFAEFERNVTGERNKFSLTQLSKKHNLSVNGLKKILKNQTYLGKIKFDGQIHIGFHQALISSTLFNHVQKKLNERGIC